MLNNYWMIGYFAAMVMGLPIGHDKPLWWLLHFIAFLSIWGIVSFVNYMIKNNWHHHP